MSAALTPTQAPLHRGYKRTAVGLIPENWTIRSLLSCLRSTPNYGINAAAIPFDDALPTYLRITDIGEDNQFRPSPRVSVRHPSVQTFFLNKGDLVFARTGASVGKSYLYNPNDGPLVFAGFLIRVSPNPVKLQPVFLAFYVQSKRYWDWVATVSIRSGQPGINGQEYGTLQLPLPGPAEQRAIAEALSDVDGLLGALEALIAKKRAIKQAAMQQLLTGKTRLPGFSGEWETKQIGDLFAFKNGLNKAKRFFGTGTPIVNYMDVFERPGLITYNLSGRVNLSPEEIKNFEVRLGDVFFTRTSETVEDVGVASVMLNELCDTVFSGFVLRARPRDNRLDNRYKQFCFAPREIRSQIVSNATYTTRALTNGRSLSAVWIAVPPKPEQRALAAVLSDMDAEIAALEQRRDKTRTIKQGMMQQLLTGKVRLVKPDIDCTRS